MSLGQGKMPPGFQAALLKQAHISGSDPGPVILNVNYSKSLVPVFIVEALKQKNSTPSHPLSFTGVVSEMKQPFNELPFGKLIYKPE